MQVEASTQAPRALARCSPKPALTERPPLDGVQAGQLAAVFETLSNDTRLRLLDALIRGGELSPSDLATALGMTPQAISNQLQRLSDKGIVQSRRRGNNVFYRVVDPCIIELLDRGLCLLEDLQVQKVKRP